MSDEKKFVYYRRGLPRRFSLVIATITRIIRQGAYAFLDEYGLEAFLPLDEIASTRIDNISDFVSIGRKYVCKVIRVNPVKKHVDISLKRVSDSERRDKLVEWKRWQKALKLFEISAIESGTPLGQLKRIMSNLERRFDDLFTVFEEARKRGPDYLVKLGVPRRLAEKMYQEAVEHIREVEVEIRGVLKMVSFAPNGVVLIKAALNEGLKAVKRYKNVKFDVKAIGAPKYRVVAVSDNYKSIERALKSFIETVCGSFRKMHMEYKPPYNMHICSFEREKA